MRDRGDAQVHGEQLLRPSYETFELVQGQVPGLTGRAVQYGGRSGNGVMPGRPSACGPLGDGVEQGLTDVAIESPVKRQRAKVIGKAVPGEPLNGWIPAHDRGSSKLVGV